MRLLATHATRLLHHDTKVGIGCQLGRLQAQAQRQIQKFAPRHDYLPLQR